MNLSADAKMTDRILEAFIKTRSKDPTPTPEEMEKFYKMCNSLNSSELSSVYKSRIEKMLVAVNSDRQRLELANQA